MGRHEVERDVEEPSARRRGPFRRFGGRGGGPPGGSAFDHEANGRGRRITATPAAAPTLDALTDPPAGPAADHLMESFDPLAADPAPSEPVAADPSEGPAEGAAGSRAPGTFDAFDGFDFEPGWVEAERERDEPQRRFTMKSRGRSKSSKPSASAPTPPPRTGADTITMFPSSNEQRVFPGGQAKLPKLGVVGDSRVHFVGTAFIRRPEGEDADGERNAFEEYFTFESLFERSAGPVEAMSTKPWEILGLEPGSAWSDVVAAHRRLAKRHHPDALVDADPDAVAAAEERFRQINWAYGELSRTRRD